MIDNGQYSEARQHLNLSQTAYDVIDQDRAVFQEKPSFAGMLNRVFELYRDYSDAAIDLACENYEAKLKKELSDIPESSAKTAIIQKLRSDHRAALIDTALSYPRERQFKFRLSRENYAYISSWRDPESAYKQVAGWFIKAVIEEYARKPMVERERIVFRDLIETVDSCIEAHKQICITLKGEKRYYVKPFCVCTDQGYNYHYLAGFLPKDDPAGEERPVSFRISNIISYRKTGRSGRLTAAQKDDIREKIRTVGVQFLLQDPELIQIRLTERGKKNYESQMHLRPPFICRSQNPDGTWLYSFSCTPKQAQFYFFKFGPDAEVLQPHELRDEFIKQYKDSLSLYNG